MIKMLGRFKLWLHERRFKRFFKKHWGLALDVSLERKNLITNYPVMSNSRCVSGLDVLRHKTIVDLEELNKEYNLEEKMLYFADKTAQL